MGICRKEKKKGRGRRVMMEERKRVMWSMKVIPFVKEKEMECEGRRKEGRLMRKGRREGGKGIKSVKGKRKKRREKERTKRQKEKKNELAKRTNQREQLYNDANDKATDPNTSRRISKTLFYYFQAPHFSLFP